MERSRRTDASVRRDSAICRSDIWPFASLSLRFAEGVYIAHREDVLIPSVNCYAIASFPCIKGRLWRVPFTCLFSE